MRVLHYVWVGHLPSAIQKDDIWAICIKYGCVKNVLVLKSIRAAIVCYVEERDGSVAVDKIPLELYQKYGKWCPATKSERGSCFTVEVYPITIEKLKPYDNEVTQNIKHLLYEIFRSCGLIMSIDIHNHIGKPGKASISFGQLSGGLEALTLKPELFGETLNVTPARSMKFFHQEIPRSKFPQGVAAEDLTAKLETMIQVEIYDDDSGTFHLFGSKVEVSWAVECINFTEELNTSSSSASVAKGPTHPTELVELGVAKIPKAAGIEEVEHLFSRFGLVAQVIKDETDQRKFYKCYIRMLVSSSDEFSLKVIPKMEDNLTLRGSTLQVSQLKAPKLLSNISTSLDNKETQPVENCKALKESKIRMLPEASPLLIEKIGTDNRFDLKQKHVTVESMESSLSDDSSVDEFVETIYYAWRIENFLRDANNYFLGYLVVIEGPVGHKLMYSDGHELMYSDKHLVIDGAIIGRTCQCDVVVSSKTISRTQAKIYREGEQVFFETLSKTNASLVNNIPVHCHSGPVRINNGYTVQVGEVPFVWEEIGKCSEGNSLIEEGGNKEVSGVKGANVCIRKSDKEAAKASASTGAVVRDCQHIPKAEDVLEVNLGAAGTPVSKLSFPGWDEVEKKLPSEVTKLSMNVQKDPTRRGSLEEFDNLLKLTNLHHENIYDVEDYSYSDKKGKKEKISNDLVGNFIKLFVAGNEYSNKAAIIAALENLAEVIDMWIPSSGYCYVVVKLLPKISLPTVLSASTESLTLRLALDQFMDKPAHYNHPIVEHGWMCSKTLCHTYNVGMECSKCGLECREGNCRAAIQQVHGVVTKIFNKSRGIVAFMEPKTGREDYAFFFRGKLDLASSSHEFENIVGKYIVFNATSTGDNWEELVQDIWVCWVVTKATIAPYNPFSKEKSVIFQNEYIEQLEENSLLNSSSESQNLFLWPTLVESVTTFWAKNLDEEELLNRLEEVHDACLMREALDEVPEVDGIYGAVLASTGRFHRAKVVNVHHIHCIELLYVDEGCSSTRSITVMRPLPLHLTSLPVAARKYELAGCYPVTDDQSLVYGHHYKGKEWLKKLLPGEEVRATGMVDEGRFLVDCIAAGLHVNTEVLDRGFTEQVLELPPNFQEIVPSENIVGLY